MSGVSARQPVAMLCFTPRLELDQWRLDFRRRPSRSAAWTMMRLQPHLRQRWSNGRRDGYYEFVQVTLHCW